MTVKKAKKPKIKMIANIKCNGTTCNINEKVILEGVTDCSDAAEMIANDSENKSCSYGCLGYGSCAQKCPFKAIEMIDGIAVVDKDKCKGCKLCVKACPRDVIDMIPATQEVVVKCNTKDFGKSVKEKCKVGCIGCQMCVKACPFFAMDFVDKLASINYNNCTNCTLCASKCPTKAISAKIEPPKTPEISEEKCIGCTVCAQICPVDAIEGEREVVHKVNEELCIGCGVCAKKCPMDAISMSTWVKYKFEERIKSILSQVCYEDGRGSALGNPFLSSYQIAIEYSKQFAKDLKAMKYVVSSEQSQNSLASYIASELSSRIEDNEITDIEVAIFSNQNLDELNFDNNGEKLTSTVTEESNSLPVFRLI